MQYVSKPFIQLPQDDHLCKLVSNVCVKGWESVLLFHSTVIYQKAILF